MFKSGSQVQAEKITKKRALSEISASASGVIGSDLIESCGEILYSDLEEASSSEDEAEGNGGLILDQVNLNGWRENTVLYAVDCRGEKTRW